MNRLILYLILLLAFASNSSLAQDKGEPATPDLKVVATPSFTMNDEKLSRTLVGVDVDRLISTISKSLPKEKGEYESSGDYENKNPH